MKFRPRTYATITAILEEAIPYDATVPGIYSQYKVDGYCERSWDCNQYVSVEKEGKYGLVYMDYPNNTKLHYFCMPCRQVSLGYKVSI